MASLIKNRNYFFFFLGAAFFLAGAFFLALAGAFLAGIATSFELLEKHELHEHCAPSTQDNHFLTTTTHRGAVNKMTLRSCQQKNAILEKFFYWAFASRVGENPASKMALSWRHDGTRATL
ncbi:hypothetical protein L6Q96_06410 [Candidatus Binatia bacterium]|nr:hypothetical protein [Candidatus Binatia bacterium]